VKKKLDAAKLQKKYIE